MLEFANNMIKSIKALTVAFWHVVKQVPQFFVEGLEAYDDYLELENALRACGMVEIDNKQWIMPYDEAKHGKAEIDFNSKEWSEFMREIDLDAITIGEANNGQP